jgi:hypothetical protein
MRTPDLRKFAEQHSDVIQWEQSNRAYILTHGVSGVERAHYRHPLPEYMYDVYMRYRKDIKPSSEKISEGTGIHKTHIFIMFCFLMARSIFYVTI